MNLNRFEDFLSQRKKVSSFKPDVPQDEVLLRLISIAQKVPSLLNVQPTRFIIVKNPDLKTKIFHNSWIGPEIKSAPMLLAFAGDKHVQPSSDVEATHKESFELLFSHKPLGFGWLFKALCVPFLRFFSPLPVLPAVYKRAWLNKEIALCTMNFILAAETAGISSTPIDFFDESRVKKILGLPQNYVVPFLLAVGYPKDFITEGPMLPLEEIIIHK